MEVNESLLDKYRRALQRGNPIEIGLIENKLGLNKTLILSRGCYFEYQTYIKIPNVIDRGLINDCPTLDNKINCSVCTHECKLRIQQLEQSKEDTSPEYPPAVIYY